MNEPRIIEQPRSESLDVTRAQLRRYLLPDSPSAGPEDDNNFPRSKVMRFAMNPRNRKMLMLSGSVLAVLASRMVGARRLGLMTDVLRTVLRKA